MTASRGAPRSLLPGETERSSRLVSIPQNGTERYHACRLNVDLVVFENGQNWGAGKLPESQHISAVFGEIDRLSETGHSKQHGSIKQSR